MNKATLIIVSLILAMVLGIGCARTVSPVTPPPRNPPLTVKLDKIGVYENGEAFFRRAGPGEVYVHIVVSDGKTRKELRFPRQEGQYYLLEKNETVQVNKTIFSTSEVGDFLSVTAIGYEADGGAFEQIVCKAIGLAIESQIGSGTGGLLEAFDFNLGNLLGQLIGAEDDWLGSYEQTWGKSNNWGIGRYTNVVCKVKGVPYLRLWFTVENPEKPLRMAVDTPPKPEVSRSSGTTIHDSLSLNQRQTVTSREFPVVANEEVLITIKGDRPIYVVGRPTPSTGGIYAEIARVVDGGTRFKAEWVKRYELEETQGQWVAIVTFQPDLSGSYQLTLSNGTGQPVSCQYSIHR